MLAQTVTEQTRIQPNPCPCGCAPCDQTCCTLDCLVQPNYFCGQLLTDADLRAGVAWSQNKFRLSRFRDGWGVVCGLPVSCKSSADGTITVGPGYAVSCCGDDIIVCKDTTLDLTQIVQPPPKPCEPTRKQPGVQVQAKEQPGGPVIVDVYIQYREEQAAPADALGRAACGQTAECDYTRVKESSLLTGQVIPVEGDPVWDAAVAWMKSYQACLKDFAQKLRPLGERWQGQALQNALKDWVKTHPIYQYCGLDDFLSAGDPNAWAKQRQVGLGEIAFLAAQDSRNSFLACKCFECDDSGVRLARVWLERRHERQRTHYVLTRIDALPPYRRLLQADCLPAPLGMVNIGEAIWRRVPDAAALFARRGLMVNFGSPEKYDPQGYTSSQALLDAFNSQPFTQLFFEIGKLYYPVIYSDGQIERLVGLTERKATS